MDFIVTWYDGPPTSHRQLGNTTPIPDAQEQERQFAAEIEALSFALDLLVQRTAHGVTVEGPDGERRSGAHLALRCREAGLTGRAN